MRRLIIDTDPGVDDAHALLVFLEAEKQNLIKIEAITLTAGNTSIENACKNIVRLLQSENRQDIPIYKGIKDPLLEHNALKSTYFGLDGFGDVFEDELDLSIIQKERSSVVICDIVNDNPGEITLVCLGPLTNIALAAKLDSNFFDKVKECFIMGGNHQGRGNQTSTGEFNFYTDPEAAYIVLKTVTCPTIILPLETCYNVRIHKQWRYEVLGQYSRMDFLNRIEEVCHSCFVDDYWLPVDGFLAITILYPNLIKRSSKQHVTVELWGRFTRGQMVLDHLKNNEDNVVIIEEIDEELYKSILLDMFQDK